MQVRAEDFLEGEFFGGEVGYKIQHLPHPSRARVKTFVITQTPFLFFNKIIIEEKL